jgi:glycerol-3-phosphate dehydrogenase
VNASEPVDLLIVGGGVNGTGIARDAAGRGLSVVLCEQDDLASHTSSASSKLIHGDLEALARHEFRQLRAALQERALLLRAAPHIVWPLRFVLPHDRRRRPAWLTRLGLLLYDQLGGRRALPAARALDLAQDPAGAPLRPEFGRGFAYADCWVDDARLVVLNAVAAAERGTEILTRTRCTLARRANALWYAELTPRAGGPARALRARALVNATGPWVARFLAEQLQAPTPRAVRLVKGVHVVVPRLYTHPDAYVLPDEEGRLLFVMPYEQSFTLIGTTAEDHDGEPDALAAADIEILYLCRAVSRYLRQPLRSDEVAWSYAGVSPRLEEPGGKGGSAGNDLLELDAPAGDAPLLSVYGGRITTHRALAERALGMLQPALGFERGAWTAGATLPGGDLPAGDFDRFLRALQDERPWLPAALARRYARAYGTRVERLLENAGRLEDLGEPLGEGLYAAEVDYLVRNEWAQTEEDVLFRRSKLGLHVAAQTREGLAAWLARDRSGAERSADLRAGLETTSSAPARQGTAPVAQQDRASDS